MSEQASNRISAPPHSSEPVIIANKTGLMKMVDLKRMVTHLRNLSGEDEVTVGGAKVRIRSRSTWTVGALHTLGYLEEFYAGLGVATTRHKYKLAARIGSFKPPHEAFNLIADFRGDVNPEKILVVGSHDDSQCGNAGVAEDIAPGCDDDLTGTVAALMLAEILAALKKAGVKFGCTIRIVHFSGEEQGCKGSEAYVQTLLQPRADLIGMIMLEMMGYTGDKSNRVDFGDDGNAASHYLAEVFMAVAKAYGLKLATKSTNMHNPSRRSDHFSFRAEKFAAACMSEDSSNRGLNPNMHKVTDELAAIDLDFYAEVVRMIVVGVAELAKVEYKD